MADVIRRADLEAQEVSYPDYIGGKILPFLAKPQQAGTLYYQAFESDVTAQAGRAWASLSSITANTITASTTTFNTSEIRARIQLGYAGIKGFESKEGADMMMGRMAKRSFLNKIETTIADKLLNVDSPTNGISDPVSTIDAAVTALRDKGVGRLAMATSNFNFVRLKNDSTVKARMQNTGVAFYGLEPRLITAEQMAAVLGVDEVLIGRDDLWHSGINSEDRGNIALVILPNEIEDPAEAVQLGRTIYFDWDSADGRYIIESWHNAITDSEVVDCKGLVDVKVFNDALCSTIQIFEASAASSSSN